MENPFNSAVVSELFLKVFDPIAYMKFKTNMYKSCFTLKDCGISSRTYNYYKGKGLTLGKKAVANEAKKQWVRPSSMEFLWLKILEQCLKLSLSTKELLTIKSELFKEWDLSSLDSPTIRRGYTTLLKPAIGEAGSVRNFEEFVDYLREHGLSGLYEKAGITITTLDLFIFLGLKTKSNVGFVFTSAKKVIPFIDSKLLSNDERLSIYTDMFSTTCVNISYWKFLNELLNLQLTLGSLLGEEIEGEPELITFKGMTYEMSQEKVLNIKEANIEKLIHQQPFQDLIIKVRDGRKISINRTIYKRKD